ncbi:hypothetical protein BMS3Bbin10_00277 [bacterium BMS3Bbin10]|nr:hypothetical protein BMS3Bbin10_00277 [bacterium BMS3Bbin10]HDL16878.1 flagellar protein FlbB [Hyphomicrobiales bacterium]
MGNVRVLPLVVFAGLCLLVLKAAGLILSGGYVLSGAAPARAQNTPPAAAETKAPAKEQATAPQTQEPQPAAKKDTADKTDKTETAKAADTAPPEAQMAMGGSAKGGTSRAELAILEGLRDRRKVLEQRERELGLRENLLEAAEKRVEARINELKAIESRIEDELKKRDNRRNTEYQRLVKMYSGMKPKDAARIFDRLNMNVLTSLASQMKPRIMSAILAAMTPAAAERLTLEMAARGRPKPQTAASLPKIRSKQAN